MCIVLGRNKVRVEFSELGHESVGMLLRTTLLGVYTYELINLSETLTPFGEVSTLLEVQDGNE